MKVLYVDTTTADLVVVLVEDNSISNYSLAQCGTHHSEALCDRIAEALKTWGIDFVDIDAYACAVGPGSFTGIRIGISTIKGYALAVPKPYIAFTTLEAIARSQNCGKKGSAIINAGNGYYYSDSANAPCLIGYDDARVSSAGRAETALQYLDGAVEIIRYSFVNKKFASELDPLYIRRSQAEENHGR